MNFTGLPARARFLYWPGACVCIYRGSVVRVELYSMDFSARKKKILDGAVFSVGREGERVVRRCCENYGWKIA